MHNFWLVQQLNRREISKQDKKMPMRLLSTTSNVIRQIATVNALKKKHSYAR